MFTVFELYFNSSLRSLESVATAALQCMLSIQQLHTSLIEIHQCNDGA